MILLEVHNRIVEELLTQQIETYFQGEKVVKVNSTIVDFDGAIFKITHGRDEPFVVSIKLKFFRDLKDHGVEDVLRREYGDLLVSPIEDFNVTLSLDFQSQLPKGETSAAWMPLVRKIAMLKRNCFSAVFEKYFEFQKKRDVPVGERKRAVIHYRENESLYVDASSDRVIVIFATVFADADDKVIGRVFMDIFREQRGKFQQAPQVIVSHGKLPDELKNVENVQRGNDIGYLTFVLFPQHTKDSVRNNTIDLIHTFRNYLHYHLKCSKAYVHARMRQKTNEFLRRLQLARPQVKKTFRTPGGTDQRPEGLD